MQSATPQLVNALPDRSMLLFAVAIPQYANALSGQLICVDLMHPMRPLRRHYWTTWQ